MIDTSQAAANAQQEHADLLTDAEAAHGTVGALIELMSSCAPGQQITAVFMRSLLCDVKAHLDNVVDGLMHPAA